jgi:hypothetical protein
MNVVVMWLGAVYLGTIRARRGVVVVLDEVREGANLLSPLLLTSTTPSFQQNMGSPYLLRKRSLLMSNRRTTVVVG